jgi:prevent-host-death family protein
MFPTITIEDAQANLKDLIDRLNPGEEIVITDNHKPIARLIGQASTTRKPRKAGSTKGKLVILEEDEEHLKDFEEYMQ